MKNRRNIIESELPPQNPLDIWMKDGKFYRSTKKGWTLIEDQMEFTDSKLMYKSTATSGTIGVNKETGKASIYNDITKEWSPLGGGVTETTWQELKDKRDAGKLTPGTLYRITDYQCTTTQENTKSAGHQFDIVLLALSEDKLAEEGWAMEHPTDVYDVTFADGVTKKCYLYNTISTNYNIVDIETLLGIPEVDAAEEITIDEESKSVTVNGGAYYSTDLTDENLTYNYFQNSNLSAWKVWYCLDNDKSRFAWADDGHTEQLRLDGDHINVYRRIPNCDIIVDNIKYFAWSFKEETDPGNCYFSILEDPNIGDNIYYYTGSSMVQEQRVLSYTPKSTGGRGVIYRLVDEWNNDVAYDFKNIQYIRPMTDGKYTPGGEDTWVYTFSLNDDGIVVDATFPDGRGSSWASHNIVNADFELPDNVFFGNAKSCFVSLGSTTNTITNGNSIILHDTVELYDDGAQAIIYLNNKKVLTES